MSDDLATPASGGGNGKYAVLGVLLLILGGGGIYALTRKPEPSPPPPATTLPAVVDAGNTPVTPSLVPEIELPPEVPDAGPPVDAGRRIRYVYRTVGGCSGTIDAARVTATARAHYGGLRACYEHELRANPSLRGPLTAQILINSSGHADDVGVRTAMSSRTLSACIKRVLRGISYPPSRGGCAIVEVPFNFTPRE